MASASGRASQSDAPRWLVVACFAAIYLIWGSTYLGIGVAVKSIPPHVMAGIRFLAAGAFLYAFLRARGLPNPSLLHWRSALIVGALLLAGANGSVSWAKRPYRPGSLRSSWQWFRCGWC